MNTSRALIGVVAGFAVGAVIGVLLAPESGNDTRKRIAQLGEDSLDDLTSRFNELRDSITSRLESVKDDGMKIVEKGQSTVNELAGQTSGNSTGKSVGSRGSSSGSGNWSNQIG